MELPNPPWYRRWSAILAGVIGLAAVVALVGLLGLRGIDGDDPEPTAANLPTTTVTSTTAAPPTSTEQSRTTVDPDVLWADTGSDNGKSPGFRAPSAWHIEWTFDCSNFKAHGFGNFKITGDGAFEDIQIQKVDVAASGSETYHLAGYGHLVVESVCDRWTVTAVAD
jgi:hypothetical protein